MIEQKSYRGMATYQSHTANVRHHYLPHDNSTLYRKFSRLYGVDVRKAPEYNLHDWLNPASPAYKPELREAIFYYSARTQQGERLKICISTKEMDGAAWRYGHCRQIVVDGTFGICSTRMLLFIALAIDEDKKGVPIALFLFSAPTGNRATHAGYNTEILRELLGQWRNHLSTGERGSFTPCVAITDTDTKERGALIAVWPHICLLLCKFHLRQCWTNKRKAVLRSVSGARFWKDHIRERLKALEVACVTILQVAFHNLTHQPFPVLLHLSTMQ